MVTFSSGDVLWAHLGGNHQTGIRCYKVLPYPVPLPRQPPKSQVAGGNQALVLRMPQWVPEGGGTRDEVWCAGLSGGLPRATARPAPLAQGQ